MFGCDTQSQMRLVDMTNAVIGDVTVVRRHGYRWGFATWLCRCKCGEEVVVAGNDLRRNGPRRCPKDLAPGQKARIVGHNVVRVYGPSRKREHRLTWNSWYAMVCRCTQEYDPSWDRYGGRGILVCEEWMGPNGLARFMADMGERTSSDLSIDRINVNGNYEPANCRWATKKTQSNNRRDNRILLFRGKSLTMAEWARELGFKVSLLKGRLRRGWSAERTLSTPAGPPCIRR
jgi:hypothetical protein